MVEVKIIYGHLKPDLKEFSGVSESKVYFNSILAALEFAEEFLENVIPIRTTERNWDSKENKYYEFETINTYKIEISVDDCKLEPLREEIIKERRIEDMCDKPAYVITDFSGDEIGTIEDDVEDIRKKTGWQKWVQLKSK